MKLQYDSFAVLGMGRFGMSVVRNLADYDVNILACDRDSARLHQVTEYATHVVQLELTDEAALQSLGLGNFDVVVLAMGEEIEASLLATMVAKEQGAKHVVVKARSMRQQRILESIGADQVILPEHEMGAKLAKKLVGYDILDVLQESEFYTITEMKPLEEWVGKTIRQADIRRRHDLTVLAIHRGSKVILPISQGHEHTIEKDDIMLVLSEHRQLD